MDKKPHSSILNDPKIEAVLNQLHNNADRQFNSLLLHYLPKLPRLLIGKGIKWDKGNTDFYNDKYIPLEREQGNFLYSLARSINAKMIVE